MTSGPHPAARWAAVTIATVLAVGASVEAGLFDDWWSGTSGYEHALKQHERSGWPILVYFYADWCPYCRRLDTTTLAAAAVQQTLRGFIKVRINPERGRSEAALAKQFRIAGYPSLFIIPAASSTPRPLRSIPAAPEAFAKACSVLGGASPPAAAPARAIPQQDSAKPGPGEVTVVLKDGGRVTGRLVLQDAKEVVVLQDGMMRAFNRTTVDRIIEGPPS